MITEGEAAILLETTLRAFGNQSQSKQRSALVFFFRKGGIYKRRTHAKCTFVDKGEGAFLNCVRRCTYVFSRRSLCNIQRQISFINGRFSEKVNKYSRKNFKN